MFGMFFFLTQFVQEILGFSPLTAGFAFLPMTLTVFGVSRAAPRLLPRFGATRLMLAGMLPVIAGMAWLAQVSAGTSYLGGILGPMLLLGAGMGVVFVPLTTVSLAGVAAADSGAASSMVNVMQQLGGALGLAILVTVFGTAYRHAAAAGTAAHGAARPIGALVHGVSAAFTVAAVFDVCALLVIAAHQRGAGFCGTGPWGAQQAAVTIRRSRPAGRDVPGSTIAAVPPCSRAASGSPSAGVATTVAPCSRARSSSTRVVLGVAAGRRGQHHVMLTDRDDRGQPVQVGGELTVGDRLLARAVPAGPVRRQGQVGRARPRPVHGAAGQQRAERGRPRHLIERDDLAHPGAVRRGQRGLGQRVGGDQQPGRAVGQLAGDLGRGARAAQRRGHPASRADRMHGQRVAHRVGDADTDDVLVAQPVPGQPGRCGLQHRGQAGMAQSPAWPGRTAADERGPLTAGHPEADQPLRHGIGGRHPRDHHPCLFPGSSGHPPPDGRRSLGSASGSPGWATHGPP